MPVVIGEVKFYPYAINPKVPEKKLRVRVKGLPKPYVPKTSSKRSLASTTLKQSAASSKSKNYIPSLLAFLLFSATIYSSLKS